MPEDFQEVFETLNPLPETTEDAPVMEDVSPTELRRELAQDDRLIEAELEIDDIRQRVQKLETGINAGIYVNIKDHGAVSGEDSTTSIQKALNAVRDAGGGVVLFPTGLWKVTSTLTVYANTWLVGEGDSSVIDFLGSADDDVMFDMAGTYDASLALTGNVSEDSDSISVADASTLSVGDIVQISSTKRFSSLTGQPQGEFQIIKNISGGTITVENRLFDSYATNDSATVRKANMLSGISFRRLKMVGKTTSTTAQNAIKTTLCRDLDVFDCNINGFADAAVEFIDCYKVSVTDCRLSEQIRTGYGYGVAVLWTTQHVLVEECFFSKQNHAVTTGGAPTRTGISRFITVTNCQVENSSSDAIDSHPPTEYYIITNNQISNSKGGGIIVNCPSALIQDNTIINTRLHGIDARNFSDYKPLSYQITGNLIRNAGIITPPSGYTTRGILLQRGRQYTENGVALSPDRLYSSKVRGLIIANNIIEMPGTTRTGECILIGDNNTTDLPSGTDVSSLTGCIVEGNHLYADNAKAVTIANINELAFTGNIIRKPDAAGETDALVRIVGSNRFTVSNNIFRQKGTSNNNVQLEKCLRGSVSNNMMELGSKGLVIDANCGKVAVIGNVFNNNTNAATISSSDNIIIRGNVGIDDNIADILAASDYIKSANVGGTANAITLTPETAWTQYVVGRVFYFKIKTTNTGSTTVNISSQGAMTLKKRDGASVVNVESGDLVANRVVQCIVTGNTSGSETALVLSGIESASSGGDLTVDTTTGLQSSNSNNTGVVRIGTDTLKIRRRTAAGLADSVSGAGGEGDAKVPYGGHRHAVSSIYARSTHTHSGYASSSHNHGGYTGYKSGHNHTLSQHTHSGVTTGSGNTGYNPSSNRTGTSSSHRHTIS